MSTDQPPTPETPAPKRCRRWVKWLKRAFLAAAVFLMGFVGWEYFQWQLTWRKGNAELQPLLAELDATDPDWRAADLCAKRNARLAPPEANTAVQALAAVKLLPKEELDRDGEERLSANKLQWWHELPLGTLPTAGELADLSELLKEFKTTVEAGKRLRELPGSGFRVAYKEPSWIATLLPHTYHIPLLASLLDREAFRQAAGGDGDGSAATVLALTAVGQSIGDEPFLISQLVRVSFEVKAARALERTLGLGSVGDTTLAKFQRTFDAETRVPRMVAGLRGERGGLHRLLENIGSGDLHPEDLEVHRPRALGTLGLLEYRTWRSRIPAQQARSLDLYNRLIAAARMPFGPPRAKTFDELELEIENVSREQETWIVRLFLPAGRKINDASTLR